MTNNKKFIFHIVLVIVGIGISFWNTWPGRLLTVLYLFLFLFLSPVTKGRENLWMFFMITCIFFSLNRPVIHFLFDLFDDLKLFALFVTAGFWTLEQILFGIVTRMIWPKQKIIRVKI